MRRRSTKYKPKERKLERERERERDGGHRTEKRKKTKREGFLVEVFNRERTEEGELV